MIVPAQDYILLTVEKKEEVTKSGIYLPEKTADTPQCGTVAQDKGNLKKGVKVWFKRWAGEDIEYVKPDARTKYGGVPITYKLVHTKDIVATEEL